MKTNESHPCFQPPPNLHVPIWRYMDFTKYVHLLQTQGLFFSRSDRLGDPYEGAISYGNIALRPIVYQDKKMPPEVFKKMSEFAHWIRQWTYINCWHMSEHESAAMWKLYAQSSEAIAIKSTYNRLNSCLPEKAFVGVVHYIDYEKDWLPEGNMMWPFVHKRESFEHEKELRAVIQQLPLEGDHILVNKQNDEIGELIPVSVTSLVECVYVSPSSPLWFKELVCNVTDIYGFKFKVEQSALAKDPIF